MPTAPQRLSSRPTPAGTLKATERAPQARRWAAGLLMLAAWPLAGLAADHTAAAQRRPMLNDTGLTECVMWDGSNYVFTAECAGTGQDAAFGRDVGAGDGNGHAGFGFQKIAADGQVLPRDAASWACVQDRVTGLVWENKTHDGGLRDVNARYTNLGDRRAGDASAFVAAVNAAGLCGAADWRLPTRQELETLVNFRTPASLEPMIDTAWFPDTAAALHWTTTSAAVMGGSADYRWAVNYSAGDSIWYGGEFGNFAVRLVRGSPALPDPRWSLRGSEVLDRATQLVWRRCAEGQAWSGTQCTGSPTVFLTYHDAILHAKAQATATGKAWRTPNIKELASLADTRTRGPAIDRAVFPGFSCAMCHSNTAWTDNPVYNWRLNFDGDGGVTRDFWGGHLMLVRDAR